MSKLYRSSVILFLMNGLGGFFNYLFLYLTVKRLSVGDLGELSSEFSIYSLALVVAVFAQCWAVFSRISPQGLRLLRWSGLVSGVAALLFAVGGSFQGFSVRAILFLSFPLVVVLQLELGKVQRAHAFAWFGICGILGAAFKLGLGFFANDSSRFALAVLLSTAVMLILMSFILRKMEQEILKDQGLPANVGQQLSASLLTAVGYAWLPAYDLLTVRYLLGPESAGVFSQLQLFSKILYYAPLTLLQVSLPHYVKILTESQVGVGLGSLRTLESRGLILSILGVAGFAIMGPFACRSILHIHEFSALQIGLVCLAVVPLYGLLSAIQIHAAANRLGTGFVFIVATGAAVGGAFILRWKTVDEYLIYSAVANSVLGISTWVLSSRLIHQRLQSIRD